jgi:hypothetical protein
MKAQKLISLFSQTINSFYYQIVGKDDSREHKLDECRMTCLEDQIVSVGPWSSVFHWSLRFTLDQCQSARSSVMFKVNL